MSIQKIYSQAALRAAHVREKLVATENERAEIAKRFGFLEVPEFSADIRLSERGKGALLDAHIQGQIVQQCGVTLEPVPESIDIDISVNFLPESEYEEEQHLADTDTELEVFNGDGLAIGETITQLFAMAANPYPRHPDADLSKIGLPKGSIASREDEESDLRESQSPFAVLGGLRKNT